MTITLHRTSQEIKGENWKTIRETTEQISTKQYDNICGAVPWFRNLGGTETVTKEATINGYRTTKIVSTSPNEKQRTIYEFTFDKEKTNVSKVGN